MTIFDYLTRLNQQRKLGRLALWLARDREPAFWDQVKRRVIGMKSADARCYIETRAAQYLHPEVDKLLKRNPSLDASAGPKLLVKSAQTLTALIMSRRLKAASRPGPKAA